MMMRRALTPRLETMENRSLLSSLMPIMGGAPNIVVSPAAAEIGTTKLAVSMTTSGTSFTPGQVVKLTFTETNDTNQDEFVNLGPSTDGFVITEGGKTVWQSNAGANPLYIRRQLLVPGQSITLTADWTATSAQGTFVAFNQLDTAATASFKVLPSTSVAAAAARAQPTHSEVVVGSLSSLEIHKEHHHRR
jgi:hypothetical protein